MYVTVSKIVKFQNESNSQLLINRSAHNKHCVLFIEKFREVGDVRDLNNFTNLIPQACNLHPPNPSAPS